MPYVTYAKADGAFFHAASRSCPVGQILVFDLGSAQSAKEAHIIGCLLHLVLTRKDPDRRIEFLDFPKIG